MKALFLVICLTALCRGAALGQGQPVIKRRMLSSQSGLIAAPGTVDPRFVPPNIRPDSGQSATIEDVVVLPDGKLLMAGNFVYAGETLQMNILRLNPDGSVDPAFAAGSQI